MAKYHDPVLKQTVEASNSKEAREVLDAPKETPKKKTAPKKKTKETE